MKNKLSLLCLALLTSSSLQAGIFDSVSGSWDSIKGTASDWYGTADKTVGSVIGDKDVGFVYDKVKSGSWDTSDLGDIYDSYGSEYGFGLESILGSEALEKLKGLGNGANLIYKYCYSYSSPSITSPFSILNPCDLASANPCDNAPDLSALGMRKKSGEDLSKYCDSLGRGGGVDSNGVAVPVGTPVVKEAINTNVKKVTSNEVLKDRYSKINAKKSGSSGSGGSSSTKSTASIINGGDKKISDSSISLANNKENPEVQKIYYQNNYKGYKLLEDANSVSNDNVELVDLYSLSNGYETIDDYKDSIDATTEIFKWNENNINLTYLKNTAESTFTNINSSTSVVAEQELQKEAEANNLLTQYEEQLEIWKVSEMQKRIWLNTKEGEQVVSPSEDMLDSVNDINTRIQMVYYGEKNKNERAKLLADVEIEAFDMLEKARNVIKMAQVNSRQFDRTTEYNKILSSLASIE
jgi:hypothetical protein